MVKIQSMGLHRPSALGYFIEESILPPDPNTSSYTWHHALVSDVHGNQVTEEILYTAHCAVWTRNGIIRRVFNLDVEGEPILHAFATRFSRRQHADLHSHQSYSYPDLQKEQRESAFVAILKTQAHIFLLSGDSHVLPLSIKVGNAFPCASGFVLQRMEDTPQTLSASAKEEDYLDSEVSSSVALPSFALTSADLKDTGKAQHHMSEPLTFSFTELLSELGVVVAGTARNREDLTSCSPLPPEETIIYLSKDSELPHSNSTSLDPVCIAVTTNKLRSCFSVWEVLFTNADNDDLRTDTKTQPSKTVRRQTSNPHDWQRTAPISGPRPSASFRESFGGLAQTFADSEADKGSLKISRLEALAQQLGHDFEPVGVQTRSARRVSSMMARTDLGAPNERAAFNEASTTLSTRKSLSRSQRRDGSIGSYNERQSFGLRRRSSFPVTTSILSNSTSFLGVPGRVSLGDFPGIEEQNDASLSQHSKNLPRAIGFIKLKSFHSEQTPKKPNADDIKVLTMLSPEVPNKEDKRNRLLSVCILERQSHKLTIVNLAMKPRPRTLYQKASRSVTIELKAVEIQRGTSISDACVISDGSIARLLIASQTSQGPKILFLESPWSPPYRLDLPKSYHIRHPWAPFATLSKLEFDQSGLGRVMFADEVTLANLFSSRNGNTFILVDESSNFHELKISLQPENQLVTAILQLCNFILPEENRDNLVVAYWEVCRWLQTQEISENTEWTAIVITLFTLAIPFISSLQDKPAAMQRRNKVGFSRTSSGSAVSTNHWETMLELLYADGLSPQFEVAAWSWTATGSYGSEKLKSPSKHSRTMSNETADILKKNAYIIKCTNMARDFLQSPAGEQMLGPEGYSPVAITKDRDLRRTSLAKIVIGLHLLREEHKLRALQQSGKQTLTELALLIVQLCSWLQWSSWKVAPDTYYGQEISNYNSWLLEPSSINTLDTPNEPFDPPSILAAIEAGIANKPVVFPSLLDLVQKPRHSTSAEQLNDDAARLMPLSFAILQFFGQPDGSKSRVSIVDSLSTSTMGPPHEKLFTDGVIAAWYRTVSSSSSSQTVQLAKASVKLIEENGKNTMKKSTAHHPAGIHAHHEPLRDYRAMVASTLEAENLTRWDVSSEVDRQTITRLIFNQDRRFQEASKLVNQTRPPEVEFNPEPGGNESNLLEAQKQLAQYVTKRTLAVATGRGMMHFNARTPLLTERVPIPAFSLQCVMKPKSGSETMQPMTFSADKALFTEDKVCWAFFHNGASAGLMISKDSQWIDTSWILYNKPPELTNRHAGFLLALGLNGHLKSLARWVVFKYLTPKHTMTSVGFLLGLAASYLGTADTEMTRLLSVHVTCLLPPGSSELNLSPLIQTTGLMGIGLLYHGSQHRRMSEVMLSEIETKDPSDPSGDEPLLRDEGYRLAAGLALGLMNLGQGHRLHALHDMHVTDRLLNIAVGTKNVNLVHVLDRATAGAVVAVALIYMKTNDTSVARKIDIPDTKHQFDYVRPDIFLLRTLARHLIMWNDISPSMDFVRESLPTEYQARANLVSIKRLSTNDLPFFNIIAGICFAIALRFAGSQRADVRDLLIFYLDQFLRLSKLPAVNYDSKVTSNGVRNCLDSLALSSATVMAGSGDIVVLRRLRSLHGRIDKETPFGSHLAAHMAIGALFLSGGTATFGTSNLAVASLVIAFYPLFPSDVLDNRNHLQALRHFWVMAVESRCLDARDADTGQVMGGIEVHTHLVDGSELTLRSPGLLPEFDRIKSISIATENYWETHLDLDKKDTDDELTLREKYKRQDRGVTILLYRRSLYDKPNADMFAAELQALDEAREVPSADANGSVNERWRHGHIGGISAVSDSQRATILDWVFDLKAFEDIDYAERALVWGHPGILSQKGAQILNGTVVDFKLHFDLGILGISRDLDYTPGSYKGKLLQRDQLWQLRLLLAWADQWEIEEKTAREKGDKLAKHGTWLRQETIDKLRWRVWKMGQSVGSGEL